jgi:hypothetical protein
VLARIVFILSCMKWLNVILYITCCDVSGNSFFPVLVDYENRSVGHRNSIYSTNQVLDAIEISSSVSYTIDKQWSLNLRFSSMFRIERKIVHVGAEKIITLYYWQVYVKFEDFSYTSNDAEDYARSEIWRKACTWSYNLESLELWVWRSGRIIGWGFRGTWIESSVCW